MPLHSGIPDHLEHVVSITLRGERRAVVDLDRGDGRCRRRRRSQPAAGTRSPADPSAPLGIEASVPHAGPMRL